MPKKQKAGESAEEKDEITSNVSQQKIQEAHEKLRSITLFSKPPETPETVFRQIIETLDEKKQIVTNKAENDFLNELIPLLPKFIYAFENLPILSTEEIEQVTYAVSHLAKIAHPNKFTSDFVKEIGNKLKQQIVPMNQLLLSRRQIADLERKKGQLLESYRDDIIINFETLNEIYHSEIPIHQNRNVPDKKNDIKLAFNTNEITENYEDFLNYCMQFSNAKKPEDLFNLALLVQASHDEILVIFKIFMQSDLKLLKDLNKNFIKLLNDKNFTTIATNPDFEMKNIDNILAELQNINEISQDKIDKYQQFFSSTLLKMQKGLASLATQNKTNKKIRLFQSRLQKLFQLLGTLATRLSKENIDRLITINQLDALSNQLREIFKIVENNFPTLKPTKK